MLILKELGWADEIQGVPSFNMKNGIDKGKLFIDNYTLTKGPLH